MKKSIVTGFLTCAIAASFFLAGCDKEGEEPIYINGDPEIAGQEFSVDENTPPGTVVGILIASDPEQSELTFSMLNQSPAEAFDLNENTGALTVGANANLNFEETESYTLEVQVSDETSQVSANVVININDLPEETEVEIDPSADQGKDAILYSLRPDNNYGDHPQINAQAWTNGGQLQKMRGLLQFDLSDLPQGIAVESVELSLYHHVAASNPGHSQISGSNESTLRRVTEAWEENTVTWNTQPATTDEGQVTFAASEHEEQDYLNIDITSLVMDSQGNFYENFGFKLSLNTEEFYRSLVFASSDIEDASKHPKLIIKYRD